MIKAYQILIREPKRKGPLGRSRRAKWEDNINMYDNKKKKKKKKNT
jgi:hypothetical protein